MHFAMVARLKRLRGFSKAPQDDEMIYKALQRKIRKSEFEMAKYCGGHHELRIALDIIEDMDLHKTFMRVLSSQSFATILVTDIAFTADLLSTS
jgi:hypothetical protein